ncbi:MAG: HEAT repeat domain-containing protein [Planctomycetota bacterium]
MPTRSIIKFNSSSAVLLISSVLFIFPAFFVACNSGDKKKPPEPYRPTAEPEIQSIGVTVKNLDKLLAQWNDAMQKPDTIRTIDLRRSLENELLKQTNLRFDELRTELETSWVMRNREVIAAALGFSKKPEAMVPLVNSVVSDPVPGVREKALLGLSRLADPNTPVDLVAGRLGADFTDGEQWNASLALKNLAAAGAKMDAALPALRENLKNRNPVIRVHCAIALGHARDTVSTPLLLSLLKDERALVGAAAADALGRIGDPETAKNLIDSLASQEYAIRTEARKALARMNNGEDLGPESGPWRRWLQKLELGKPASAPALEPAASNASSNVK